MNHSIKLNRIKGSWHNGPVTRSAVLNQIPAELIAELSSRQLSLIAEAIHQAYCNGKNSNGGLEMVDETGIWIPALNRIIDISEIKGA